MKNNWVFASSNQGKVVEMQALLVDSPYRISPLPKDCSQVEETGLSFVENALLKARAASAHTSLPCLADDSGLVVPSLDGEPGVFSARYAGEHSDFAAHMHKLLDQLAHSAPTQRAAYFICVLALITHPKDPCPILAQGTWHGQIHTHPQGSKGFGYDPIFFVPEHQLTAAQLAPEHKNRLSHRAIAIKHLLTYLPQSL